MYSSALGITTCVTLLLCVFHAACGLRCYTCETTDPKACTEIETCPPVWDSCSTLVLGSKSTSHIMSVSNISLLWHIVLLLFKLRCFHCVLQVSLLKAALTVLHVSPPYSAAKGTCVTEPSEQAPESSCCTIFNCFCTSREEINKS